MQSVANDLESLLKIADRLRAIQDAEASIRPAPGKWSAKETLGHLIDSAANNHQRFVRVQIADGLKMAGYEQVSWVRVQQYASTPWGDLVALWRSYNHHLARVVAAIQPAAFAHRV